MNSEIKYINAFNQPRDQYKTITHENLDKRSAEWFTQGFAEMIPNSGLRRLYFDVELDEYKEGYLSDVISWLNNVAGVLNTTYAACGYTIDNNFISEYEEDEEINLKLMLDFKSDESLHHAISFHVIFNKVFDAKDLYEVLNKPEYIFVKDGVDMSVYKDANKQQLLRHAFATKIKSCKDIVHTEIDFENFENQLYKASELVVTPNGNESVGTIEELKEAFCYDESKKIINNLAINSINTDVNDDETNPDEIVELFNNSDMSKELFEALYKGFKGLLIHNDAEKCDKEITLFPLFSALYKCINNNITEDDVDEALDYIQENAVLTANASKKWNSQLRRAMKNDDCKNAGALFKYVLTFNEEYYNEIVKPLLPKRKQLIETKFDLKDSFSIKDMRTKGDKHEYQLNNDDEKLDYNAILSDLKRVMIVVDQGSGIYVIKERDAKNDRMIANYYNQETAFKMLKQLKVGTELKQKQYRKGEEHQLITKTAFDVYDASTNNAMFYKNSICFYSENEDDFSFFQGYKYNAVQNDNLIEKFNNHVKYIICSGDEVLYNYVQSWFATIIQTPIARACTALVIKGSEGTGKNTVTNVWSELLRGYANSNVTDLDSIIGKFNTSVENKKLLVINEMDSAEMSTTAIFNRLKKLITEDTVDIHTKNVNVRAGVENIANLVILSNEFNPVKISTTDRRYCIITPSEVKAQNKCYFNELYADMKTSRTSPYRKDFMEALMYYYMNYNVKIDLTEIPETRERAMAKEANKSAIELFVEEFAVELSGDGIAPKECFDMFNRFIYENKFKANYKSTTFKAEMSKFCAIDENNQLRRYKMKRVYRFNDTCMKRYEGLVEQMRIDKAEQIDIDDIPVRDE